MNQKEGEADWRKKADSRRKQKESRLQKLLHIKSRSRPETESTLRSTYRSKAKSSQQPAVREIASRLVGNNKQIGAESRKQKQKIDWRRQKD